MRGGLRRAPRTSAWGLASRKGAFCMLGLTERRSLSPPLPQSASFREIVPPECAFPYGTGCRMRFSVECAFPHLGKRRVASRKSAFCAHRLTQKRTLYVGPHGKAQSVRERSRRVRLSVRSPPGGGAQGNRPPECGALWKKAQLGKRARATARQNAGGLRQVTPSSREVCTPLRTTASHDRDRLEASKKGTRPVTAGAPKVICQLALTTVLRCCASPVPLRQPFCQNYPYIWSWQVRAMTSSCCSRVRSMNFTA